MYAEFSKTKTKECSFLKQRQITQGHSTKEIKHGRHQLKKKLLPVQLNMLPKPRITREAGALRDYNLNKTKGKYRKGENIVTVYDEERPNKTHDGKTYFWAYIPSINKLGYIRESKTIVDPPAYVAHRRLGNGNENVPNNMVGGLPKLEGKTHLYHAHFIFKEVQDLPTGKFDNIGFHSKNHDMRGPGELYSEDVSKSHWSKQLGEGDLIYDEKMLVEAIWLHYDESKYSLITNDCQTWKDKVLKTYHELVSSGMSALYYRDQRINRMYLEKIKKEEEARAEQGNGEIELTPN